MAKEFKATVCKELLKINNNKNHKMDKGLKKALKK